MNPKENKRNLWKNVFASIYQYHVTISTIGSTTESAEEIDDKVVYMEDLEKRKQVYGICGECNEPGTGSKWCQPYPNTKDYMMVLEYCENGNLRNYYMNNESSYGPKIEELTRIASGLLDIHNAGKIHKDFHSGNILYDMGYPYISDLGMCQPANNEKQLVKQEGIYGVLPYMAPEVLRGYQYTKASDIYSFGIMMNEYISEETPYNNIPHNHALAIEICKGLRPNIFKYTPKLLADLITKCWDAKAENRPTAKELYQELKKLDDKIYDPSDIKSIKSQIYEYDDKIKLNRTSEKRTKNIQTHPQAIYTSRLLNFKNLPEPVNSDINKTTLHSECFDCQLDELDIAYITRGGFDKIYSAELKDALLYWDIEDQKWKRYSIKFALKKTPSKGFEEWSFPKLVAGANLYEGKFELQPEKNITGPNGHGPVDFAIDLFQTAKTVGVIERKASKMEEGDTFTGKTFGIITDAKVWYFMECSYNKGKPSFKLSELYEIAKIRICKLRWKRSSDILHSYWTQLLT
ncbi:kinase-like protein [Rhizophagus irregularis]|uniref:Kinase-like protein n=1 Tax=Rhizophagus irregularis TaxID=588596 RepID=A0A2N1N5F6_9GLOM|nr:kinase-like protein [Rhizophagus irregularis]